MPANRRNPDGSSPVRGGDGPKEARVFHLRSRSRVLAYVLSIALSLAATAVAYAGDGTGPLPK